MRWSSAPCPMRAAPAWRAWIGANIRRTSTRLARTGRYQAQEQEKPGPQEGGTDGRESLVERLIDEEDPARRLDDRVGDQAVSGAAVHSLIGRIELGDHHDRGRDRVDDVCAAKLLAPLKRTAAHGSDLR